jgi:hypothetical protein
MIIAKYNYYKNSHSFMAMKMTIPMLFHSKYFHLIKRKKTTHFFSRIVISHLKRTLSL